MLKYFLSFVIRYSLFYIRYSLFLYFHLTLHQFCVQFQGLTPILLYFFAMRSLARRSLLAKAAAPCPMRSPLSSFLFPLFYLLPSYRGYPNISSPLRGGSRWGLIYLSRPPPACAPTCPAIALSLSKGRRRIKGNYPVIKVITRP
jgi:hypothetical protein